MRIVASIQARMGSSRLPGKVLKLISKKPMLLWQVERIRRARLIDEVIVATSIETRDDEIEEFCFEHKISCYRGREHDVLNRVSELIRERDVDLHVECFGDSPLTDPQIVDEFVGYFLRYQNNIDFVSNTLKPTYPSGFEINVYYGEILCVLDQELPEHDPMREHGGYNITRFPKRFRLVSMEAPPYFNRPEISLEVDTDVDLELIKKVVTYFAEQQLDHFSLSQILDLLKKKPQWAKLNSHVVRRWKVLHGAE